LGFLIPRQRVPQNGKFSLSRFNNFQSLTVDMPSSFRAVTPLGLAKSLFPALGAACLAHSFPLRDRLAAVAGFEAGAGTVATLIRPFGFENLGIAVLGVWQHTRLEVAAGVACVEQTDFERTASGIPDIRSEAAALVIICTTLTR
jgi:hypothetical protein